MRDTGIEPVGAYGQLDAAERGPNDFINLALASNNSGAFRLGKRRDSGMQLLVRFRTLRPVDAQVPWSQQACATVLAVLG